MKMNIEMSSILVDYLSSIDTVQATFLFDGIPKPEFLSNPIYSSATTNNLFNTATLCADLATAGCNLIAVHLAPNIIDTTSKSLVKINGASGTLNIKKSGRPSWFISMISTSNSDPSVSNRTCYFVQSGTITLEGGGGDMTAKNLEFSLSTPSRILNRRVKVGGYE